MGLSTNLESILPIAQSAGHDMIALDYLDCWNSGEPSVVHVDQECDYQITKIADTYEEFIRKLEPDEHFDDAPSE